MTDPVGLDYDLHLLPRGRTPFRRWHWELWHGPTLLAAGWRLQPLEAQRSIRVHAVRYAHRLHGLRVLHPDVDHPAEVPWQGRTQRFVWGALQIELRPRAARLATQDISAAPRAG
ncbi:hypothetical protein [Conexibacter sp. DBS9H8]|uniref:hypothetical protein n=1 Tax=Conexibacter sp. DBS9H8 TaxID=2937801 RepID=UPI00200CFCAA|nr:hypothetical protein [Conexibacter sp. DBS9H8]